MSVLRRDRRTRRAGAGTASAVTESTVDDPGPGGGVDAPADADPEARAGDEPAPAAGSEAVAEGEAAPAGPSRPARRRRLPGRPRTWLAVAAAVVLAALVLALVVLLRTPSEAQVRESALLAARTYSTSLTTFDARTFDEDVERVRRSSTEEFVAQYDETVGGLRETVEAEQTVSTGTVVGAGLEQVEGSTATVLVAVNQQLVSADGPPRTEANRLRMVLERRDGQWLIKDVDRV